MTLTDAQHTLLQFEESRPRHSAAKAGAILATFQLTPARYYQQLFALVVSPDAVAAYPQLAARVQRQQRQRATQRRTRTF